MPDASIVVKATDRHSDAVKKMATVTRFFSKDVDKKGKNNSLQRARVIGNIYRAAMAPTNIRINAGQPKPSPSQKFRSICSEGFTPSRYSNLCSENHRKPKMQAGTKRINPSMNMFQSTYPVRSGTLCIRMLTAARQVWQAPRSRLRKTS